MRSLSFNFMIATAIVTVGAILGSVLAQEGTPNIQVSGVPSTYTCNPQQCVPPNCYCASLNPPGNIPSAQAPQFVTITFDDSIQKELLATAQQLLAAKNPNGCPARGTWFVSIEYTDFSLVEQWYAAGNEIADHTFSHVGSPSSQEIASCKAALTTYGGIPRGKVQGFRAPFLNYTAQTLQYIASQGFLYDSSTSATTNDAFWPYTLDNGLANDCWTGICAPGTLKLPGLWEIPMHAVIDNANIPQLMDVYLAGSADVVNGWMQTNFDRHYNGNRAPFGIYVHPTHLTKYPGLPDPTAALNGVLSFISSIASKPNVWFVTNQQLLQYMKNPVPASQLGSQSYMQCQTPQISTEICNGLDDTHKGTPDSGLLQSCNFVTTTWSTCFNCPASLPSVSNPTPPSAVAQGQPGYRYPVPDTCDTLWWDPIGNTCLCNSTSCAWKDNSQQVVLSSVNGTADNRTSVVVDASLNGTGSGSTHSGGVLTRGEGWANLASLVIAAVAVLLW